MKIGMIGLPQVGKKTLFELLTGHAPSEKELASGKPIKGVAEVKDGRFDTLVSLYAPKKEVCARVDVETLPDLSKEAIEQGLLFADISDVDAICHVVRSFANDAVYHIDGSVNSRRDFDFVNAELILHDLIFIEKRMERIDKALKQAKDENVAKERAVLVRLKDHLETERPLRTLPLDQEALKMIASYPLVTRKAMIAVLNVSEADIRSAADIERMRQVATPSAIEVMQVSAKIEREVAEFETDGERKEFLRALGIEEPALNALTRLLIATLGLISFFTVGTDEVRQWLIRAGSTAPEAAGAIHSDLQKGFIRAEVMKYDDLVSLGTEEKVKEMGKFALKGKDYIVQNGDIINIRFNV